LGVRPESKLARDAGLELGATGGIKVDAHLRTSDPNIYAVGDAIEVAHGVTGAPALIPLGGPANRQGRTAADNIFGTASEYPGTLGTAIVRVFDLTAAVTGANEAQLTAAGVAFDAVHLHPNSHAGYYPGAKPVALKVLFAPGTGRLLGAQAVGAEGVDKRIDVLATALRAGMTVDDVAELELCYAPPFGSAKDPVNLAGMAAQNARAGRVRTIQWHEVGRLDPERTLILDVRDAKEREGGAIPGSAHVPLAELRARLGELPRDKEIVAHCATGQRSYSACRVLAQRGFRCRNLTGSFKTWKAAQAGPN
jgi:rhodanese-related sulfurtransferase